MTFPRKRYDASKPGGSGYREENMHPGSGLRCAYMTGMFNQALGLIVNNQASSETATFTDLTLVTAQGRLIVPCTPVITYSHNNATPVAKEIQFRVSGFDQFGNHITETTPAITTTITVTTEESLVVLSKVFAYVSRVEFRCVGFQTSDVIDVGQRFIFDAPAFDVAADEIFGGTNMGIGTPLRVMPYGANALAVPIQPANSEAILWPEILSLTTINHSDTDKTSVLKPWESTVTGGFMLGQNASGYEGCHNKVNIVIDTANGEDITSIAGTVDDLALTEVITFNLAIRSLMNTGRRTSGAATYRR